MPHPTQLSVTDTALLVIDVQEKLMPLIHKSEEVVRNIEFLIDGAKLLELPVLATEQYPKGLGSTVSPLIEKLPDRPEKVTFSCAAIPEVVERLHSEGRPKVVLSGIESHVCVQQTALDLLAGGFRIYLAVDAISCRFPMDHEIALRRLQKEGAILTTCESVLFECMASKDHPAFKGVSGLVQARMKAMQESGS